MSNNNLFSICGEPSPEIENRIKEQIRSLDLNMEEIKHFQSLKPCDKDAILDVDEKTLDLLRHAARFSAPNMNIASITSHRKVIGPFIVAVKKQLFRIVRFCFKDLIREQSEFNATVLKVLLSKSRKYEQN